MSATFCGATTLPLRLRHLAAFAVDDEAVRQQRLVRRHAVQHARHEQRRVEPAAVLVGAFEIEIGREARVERPASRRRFSRPSGPPITVWCVEPESNQTSSVSVSLRYLLASTPKSSCVASNHASMPPSCTFAAASSSSAGRIGMQRVGRLVDEERQRHAPLPLPRQRPVGPMRDHAMQPRLAPGREELRRLDAGERGRAQRAPPACAPSIAGHVVHAGEPLRRRAIDDRRLVPPAMHVAVRELLCVQQCADLAQLVDDLRVRVPDLHAAEERQVGGEARRRPAPGSACRRRACRSARHDSKSSMPYAGELWTMPVPCSSVT